MPTYEYACQDCQHRFSIRQSMSDDPLTTCPECGGTIERVITGGAGLFLKKDSSEPLCDMPGCGMGQSCRAMADRFGAPPCGPH